MKRVVVVIAILIALAVSYIAGMVTVIRAERGARQVAPTADVQPQVVFNGCATCDWGAILCWLSGC